MHALVSLASALNNADADGRIVIDAAGGSLKFLLLNAAAHFAKVIRSLTKDDTPCAVPSPGAMLVPSLLPCLCLHKSLPNDVLSLHCAVRW